jgi:hypothetical protein
MKILRFLPALLLALLGAGCASVPATGPGCVAIGPSGAVCPLPPGALPAVSARHLVTVTQDGQTHTFLGRLQIDAANLRLAGASLFGTHLFTITWDGQHITSAPPQAQLRPQLMVVMLEVALADPAALRPRLHGLVLKVEDHDGTEVRQLFARGRLVARVERHGAALADAHLVMTIPPARLTLRLAPLEAGQR